MALDKNTYPYFDNYSESKKYYQILFRPSIAVQSRELSQLQSILQKQIDYFGKSIFKEGAMVIPGETVVDFAHNYVKIEDLYNLSEVSVSSFYNKKIAGTTSGAVANVIGIEDDTVSDPKTLFVKYLTGSSVTSFTGNITNSSAIITNVSVSATSVLIPGMVVTGAGIPSNSYIVSVNSSSQITISNQCSATTTGVSLTATSSEVFDDAEDIVTLESSPIYCTTKTSATGIGTTAHIGQGIYFINGYFCLVEEQEIVLEKYTTNVSCKVGLSYNDEFITEEDDVSLVDPANGSPNYNAPGAHRYYINIVLTKIDIEDNAPSNFVELIRIKNGTIQSMVTRTEYSELEKTFARRTYDESGNYTVKSFPLTIREHLNDGENSGVYTVSNGGDSTKLVYALDNGKAYVKGYEIELISSKFLEVNKARDTKTSQNYTLSSSQGNYVIVDNAEGTFDISAYEDVTLKDVSVATIGTAKVSGMVLVSGTPGQVATTYKLFLFDIVMNTGRTFSEVITITGDDHGAVAKPVLESSAAVLYYPNTVNAILSTSEYAIKSISDISYTTRRYHSGAMSTTTLTLTANTGETFASGNVINYHVSILSASATALGNGYANGDIIDMNDSGNLITLGGSPTGKQVTLTIPDISGSTIAVISTVTKTSPTIKTKTLTSRTQATLAHGATVTLDKADIFDIVSIIDNTSLVNITSHYVLDNGQRDSYYDRGRLIFNSGFAAPSGTISVTYRYLAHGAGDLFTVDSYNAVIDYADIPLYRSTTGKSYDMINCLDFRPRINDAGTGFSVTSEVVADGQTVLFDYEYYLGRIDKIVLDSSGNFNVISGVSDIYPLPPKDPINTMVLYQVSLPPYTFNATDVTFSMVDNRRYTMRDIGKLDTRIGNLEYYTTLSLLEKSTSDMFIDDGLGNNRFKNGFIVDNFKSHLVGNTSLRSYQCSIDSQNGYLRPPFDTNDINMILDETNSTNYQKTGTLITLPYTETKFISQPFASKTVNVNPYAIFSWIGRATLTPSSDTWFETTRLPDYVLYSEDQISNQEAAMVGSTIWGGWETDWIGKVVSKTQVRDPNTQHNSNINSENRHWGEWRTHTSEQRGLELDLLSDLEVRRPENDFVVGDRLVGTATFMVASESRQSRTGITYELGSSITNEVVDDKVISSVIIPYMREKQIYFEAFGLRPNTKVYPIFDNIDVTDYCKPDLVGSVLGDDLVTDNNGEVKGYFTIPCTDALKFSTGAKTFKLVDNIVNVSNSTTSASSIYTAKGILDTKQASIISTKRYELVQKEITDTQTTIVTSQQKERVTITWNDPLAQTFLISNPEGCFVSKIQVYVSSKDDSGIPLRLQIRNTVNGYPGQYIVPMSDVFINPEDITVSADASVATTFTFPSPIYLEGESEYCFVLMSNSNKYNVWISELGGTDISTGSLISEQPYSGVMFKSQNASTWTASQEEDIKFDIYRCSFNTGVQGNVVLRNEYPSLDTLPANPFTTTSSNDTITVYHPSHSFVNGDIVQISEVSGVQNGVADVDLNSSFVVSNITFDTYDIVLESGTSTPTVTGVCGGVGVKATSNVTIDSFDFNSQTLTFSKASLDWSMKALDDTFVQDSYRGIVSHQTIDLDEPRFVLSEDNEATVSVNIKGILSSTSEWISPVIDTERQSLICISNRINNNTTDETDAGSGGALARYITKKITLAAAANSAKIYFSAIRPVDCDIKVYIKYRKDGEQTDFNSLEYTELTAISYPNFDNFTFKDYEFDIDTLDPFSIFSIKIIMLGSNTSNVPVIKEFRAIATSM